MLYRVVLTFESVNEKLEGKNFIKTYCALKLTVLTSVFHKGVLTFESWDVNCDYSYEN